MRSGSLALAVATLFALGCADSDPSITAPAVAVTGEPVGVVAAGAKPMILRLLGTDAMSIETVPDPEGLIDGDEAFCYTVPMWDVAQDRIVGTAKDCISILGFVDAGVQVVGTTTFDFGGGHWFTTQGLTSVQPVTHGSPGITHITGAIPAAGVDGVVAASGRFKKLGAAARLSGAVNLTDFPATATFDCLFIIDPL